MDKKIGCVQHDCDECRKRLTPLSDDEIDKILDNDDLWKVEGDEVYVRTTEFARAIEAAHGIGVKDAR